MSEREFVKGGMFLLEPAAVRPIFTREELNEEQLMIGKTAWDFIEKEIMPRLDEFEDHDKKRPLNKEYVQKAGELGLLAVDIPEEYGGFDMGFTTGMYVTENVARASSFSVSMMAHSGIGVLPIRFFGNKLQKDKYLAKLASGELIAAFCLTEAATGSDALALKTKATLSEDGKHYILNGEKMWITNGGFADIFIVYARVDDDKKVSAFIVEGDSEGFTRGKEEDKMGIMGSSTTALHFDNVKVPVENMLGARGKGHKSAFGILDIGRFKLGVGCYGGCKDLIATTAKYGNERKQFGMTINSFGMIRRKYADMAMRIFALESEAYRTSDMMDVAMKTLPPESEEGWIDKAYKILEMYNVEASILKVYGSEVLDFVVDECVQIHGGYGYSEEYPIARAYRDARINRIFEGTNEINRLVIPGTFFRKVMKGELDFMGELNKVLAEIKQDAINKEPADGPLGREITAVNVAKKTAIYTFGCIAQKHMAKMQDKTFMLTEFEYPLEGMANLAIDIYAMDSALCRAIRFIELKGEERGEYVKLLAQTFIYQTLHKVFNDSKLLLADVADGDPEKWQQYSKALHRLYWFYPYDLAKARDKIAQRIIEEEGYSL